MLLQLASIEKDVKTLHANHDLLRSLSDGIPTTHTVIGSGVAWEHESPARRSAALSQLGFVAGGCSVFRVH